MALYPVDLLIFSLCVDIDCPLMSPSFDSETFLSLCSLEVRDGLQETNDKKKYCSHWPISAQRLHVNVADRPAALKLQFIYEHWRLRTSKNPICPLSRVQWAPCPCLYGSLQYTGVSSIRRSWKTSAKLFVYFLQMAYQVSWSSV
jgi:hypothetical protein